MAKRICCDVCYSYKVGPFKEVEHFVICAECFEKLKSCDDFMAEDHFNGTEWDNHPDGNTVKPDPRIEESNPFLCQKCSGFGGHELWCPTVSDVTYGGELL